jgi:hypothetical protein
MGLPRIRLVFRFWECDNENQTGVRARQRAPCQGSASSAGSSPSVNASVKRKKKPALSELEHPAQCDWPVNVGNPVRIRGYRTTILLRFIHFDG